MATLDDVPITPPRTTGSTLIKTQTAGGEKYLALDDLKTSLVPHVEVLTQTVTAASFTDGGGAIGTKVMTGSIPAGAVLIGTKLLVGTGFTGGGQASCTLTIGDGSDVDRYNTGTPSVFTTAATGVETGVPSGSKLITTANAPTLTITANADITGIIGGPGVLTLSIYYVRTV